MSTDPTIIDTDGDIDVNSGSNGRVIGLGQRRPTVVTLCGSMRFASLILAVAGYETSHGHIVLAPFVTIPPAHQDDPHKRMLDEVHLRKIDMADEIMVITDHTHYIGDSTTAEITYATTVRHIPAIVCVPHLDPATHRWYGAWYWDWGHFPDWQNCDYNKGRSPLTPSGTH